MTSFRIGGTEKILLTDGGHGTIIKLQNRKTRGCAMRAHRAAGCKNRRGCLSWMPQGRNGRTISRLLGRVMLLAGFVWALGAFAVPEPAAPWWPGHAYYPANGGGYGWRAAPWVLFPFQRPRPDYRYSVPPGAP